MVDATLEDGSLTYGEVRSRRARRTVLLTTTVCHPALANDNLSGIVVLAALARVLAGAASPLATASSGARARSGRSAGSTRTPRRSSTTSRTASRSRASATRGHYLQAQPARHDARSTARPKSSSRDTPGAAIVDWSPYGGDERQFCSPGFDLPFGAFSRSPATRSRSTTPPTTTSPSSRPRRLRTRPRRCSRSSTSSSATGTYVNASPFGEPQLGRRGLYRSIGGGSSREAASSGC